MSNIETITREHDNFSSSYDELVNLLEKVITNKKITQDDKYDLEKVYVTYSENYNEVKRILENEKENDLKQQIEKVNESKLDANLNSIMNILTNNGEKTALYLDEDGVLYIDGEHIPELKEIKFTVGEHTKSISEITQTAEKINWLVKSGTSESDMELTDKLFSLMTEKVLIDAKNIELNGSININEGKFMVQTNGNLKIGGLTGRTNGDGTQQGIFEVNSKGKVFSRNPDDANIYSIFDDGTIEVRNGDIRFKVGNNGIQIKNFGENGGELVMDDKNITTENLSLLGKLIVDKGIKSNSYVRSMSLAINNKKFSAETSNVNSTTQSRLFLGDTLIIYGRTSFTGLTASTTATSKITFDKVQFANPPVVMVIPNSSSPHQCNVGAGSITTTGCNVYLNRTNTTDTNVFWIAIGERGGSDTFVD